MGTGGGKQKAELGEGEACERVAGAEAYHVPERRSAVRIRVWLCSAHCAQAEGPAAHIPLRHRCRRQARTEARDKKTRCMDAASRARAGSLIVLIVVVVLLLLALRLLSNLLVSLLLLVLLLNLGRLLHGEEKAGRETATD